MDHAVTPCARKVGIPMRTPMGSHDETEVYRSSSASIVSGLENRPVPPTETTKPRTKVSSEAQGAAGKRSATLSQPASECACASEATALFEAGHYKACVAHVSAFLARTLEAQTCTTAHATTSRRVPAPLPTPLPFSFASEALHAALCSLLELRQLEAASELLRLWHGYTQAAAPAAITNGAAEKAPRNVFGVYRSTSEGAHCAAPQRSERSRERLATRQERLHEAGETAFTALWTAVYHTDAALVSLTGGGGGDSAGAIRGHLYDAISCFQMFLEARAAVDALDAQTRTLHALHINAQQHRETLSPSPLQRSVRRREALDAKGVEHGVRLVYLALERGDDTFPAEPAHGTSSKTPLCPIDSIIAWIRGQPGITSETARITPTWCLWQLCEAIMARAERGERFVLQMQWLSKAAATVQATLRRCPASRELNEGEKRSPSSTHDNAARPSSFSVSPLVAAIVKKHAQTREPVSVVGEPSTRSPTQPHARSPSRATPDECMRNSSQSASTRSTLLMCALQFALTSFLWNAQAHGNQSATTTKRSSFHENMQLHLEEFLVVSAMLDRENKVGPLGNVRLDAPEATSGGGNPNSVSVWFRVKATVKLIDGLVFLARDERRRDCGPVTSLIKCGLRILHDTRQQMLEVLQYATRKLHMEETKNRIRSPRTPAAATGACYLSLMHEQAALLTRTLPECDPTVCASLLRSALVWWAYAVGASPSSTRSLPRAHIRNDDDSAEGWLHSFAVAIDHADEGILRALYADDANRCLRLIVAYSAACCAEHYTVLVGSRETNISPSVLLLRALLHLTEKHHVPISGAEKGNIGRNADVAMVRAALSRSLAAASMADCTNVPSPAGTIAANSSFSLRDAMLEEAEQMCVSIPGVLPPTANDGALVTDDSGSFVFQPLSACTFPYFLLEGQPSFAMWEARVLAHQTLAECARKRWAAASAIHAAPQPTLSAPRILSLAQSVILHLRYALLERRQNLGEEHAEVAAAHVALGKALFAFHFTQACGDVTEALRCAHHAQHSLSQALGCTPRAMQTGAEGLLACLSRHPVFVEASALKARCVQVISEQRH